MALSFAVAPKLTKLYWVCDRTRVVATEGSGCVLGSVGEVELELSSEQDTKVRQAIKAHLLHRIMLSLK